MRKSDKNRVPGGTSDNPAAGIQRLYLAGGDHPPDSVEGIGYRVFENCVKLTRMNYPLNWSYTISRSGTENTDNNGQIFRGCTSLKEIEVPEGVTAIPDYAFNGCTELEEVLLPEALTAVGDSAFYSCTGLEGISLPGTLTAIGKSAFSECSSLKTIKLPETVSAMGNQAFMGCSSLVGIVLPGALESVPESAFEDCTGLRSVAVSEGTTDIASYAFRDCGALTAVELPDGLLTIQRQAFSGCGALEEIALPDSVEGIGYRVFENCAKLTRVNYPLNWSYTISRSGTENTDSNGQIFLGCTSLKEIEVPEGVTAVPDYAFNGCGELEEVVLPESLTTIGEYAFYDCISLRDINLEEGIAAVPAYCFYNCIGLDRAVFPSTVESIGDYAYCNCTGLRTVTMDVGLKTIGIRAFSGCSGVLSLVLNDGLETVGDRAFSDCANMVAVELPASITSNTRSRVDGCPKLTVYCYSGTESHMVSEEEGYNIYLLDEHDHEYTATVETSPTCTRGGSQILTCSVCGYYYVEILDPLGHDYKDTVTEPSCVEDGYTLHECTRCGDTWRDSYVKAPGHEYGEWETVAEASCTEDGSRKRVCGICGYEDIQVIEAPGHSYEDAVIPPTCTSQGCTVHTCTVCGEAYGDQYVDALGHSFGEWVITKNSTVLQCGTRTRTCSVCAAEESEELEKLTVDIENNTQYGLANFTVLDAMSLEPVSGASIYITTEKDGEGTLIADENGRVSQVLPVGQWTVGVYAEGYLVRNVKITVEADEQDIPPIGISDKPLVDAKITTTEMTYDEMIAAGIDVDSSDNKQYYEYKVEIQFHETLDIMSFISYGDSDGKIISTTPDKTNTSRTVYALSHDGTEVEAEPVTVVYSEEYGTYITDRSTLVNAVWSPSVEDTLGFENNGYYFEGYGIPSELTMTTTRVFPDDGWKYNAQSGKLSMSVGERTHYMSFMNGNFCTTASRDDSIPVKLFERISADGYPTEKEYVYIPAETFEAGKQYLLLQFSSSSLNSRKALSHSADLVTSESVTIHADDVYGDYIADLPQYENAVWLSASAGSNGLKIVNNHYYAQVEDAALACMPLPNGIGWTLDEDGHLTATVGGETYYLRHSAWGYDVTSSQDYAGRVTVYEKTSATDVVSAGKTETEIIYRVAETFEAGKEYIIVGSSRSPGGGGISSQGGGSYSGSGGNGFDFTLSDGTTVTVYPVSEKFYLIIYGEVSWLKEMFDVEMLILNNSSTDTIENCVAELILPEGLSLADMVEGEQSAVQTVDHIPENGSHSLHWYVRGDKEGVYNITATLAGTMMPFDEDFYYEYVADSPIKVYAGSAMKMTFHIPEAAYKDVDYTVKIELENVSDKVLYNVTHSITGWEQGKITYYSDGSEVREIYGSGGMVGSKDISAFYPGDKIVIEVSFEILFESTIMKNLMETVNQAEQLSESFQAIKSAYDLIKSLTGFCSSAGSSLDKIIKAGKVTDTEKMKAANALLDAINKLYGKFEKGDSEAVKLANNIQSTEAYKQIKSCADELGCEAFIAAETAENLFELADKIICSIGGEEEEDEEKPFNAFDSLRTMVSQHTDPVRR